MSDENNVAIAEKVKFWEEQDRINQALIPRVLELHTVVSDLAKRSLTVNDRIATAEARNLKDMRVQLAQETRQLQEAIQFLSTRYNELNSNLEALKAKEETARSQANDVQNLMAQRFDHLDTETVKSLTAMEERILSSIQVCPDVEGQFSLFHEHIHASLKTLKYAKAIAYAALGVSIFALIVAVSRFIG